jgi:hypothetical protein
MLEEVGGAVGLGGLGAGAGIDPHADGRGLGIRRVLGRDLERAMRVSDGRARANANWGREWQLTVRPFLSVVVSVLIAGDECGVARPRLNGTDSPPARPRRPCARFRASLRDAMDADVKGGGVWKMSGLKERAGSSLASKNYGMKRNFASLPRPARERPGQSWLGSSCHVAQCGSLSWHFEIRPTQLAGADTAPRFLQVGFVSTWSSEDGLPRKKSTSNFCEAPLELCKGDSDE